MQQKYGRTDIYCIRHRALKITSIIVHRIARCGSAQGLRTAYSRRRNRRMRRRRRRRSKRTMRGLFKIITILFVKKDSNTRKSLTGIFDNRTHLKGNFLTMHSKRKILGLGGGGSCPKLLSGSGHNSSIHTFVCSIDLLYDWRHTTTSYRYSTV